MKYIYIFLMAFITIEKQIYPTKPRASKHKRRVRR